MTTTPTTRPQLDHDTMVFVLEELNDQIKGIYAEQKQAVQDDMPEVAARHFFEGSALQAYWDRIFAVYKEQQEPSA